MEDGCIHNIFENMCNIYGYLCNGSAQNKEKCPQWGMIKAYEDSLHKDEVHHSCETSDSPSLKDAKTIMSKATGNLKVQYMR